MQGFQFFRLHSVPSSFNDYTAASHESAQPRREEACAVCAVKDWLENRYAVHLYQEGTNTTTWENYFYGAAVEEEREREDDDDDNRNNSAVQALAGQLLINGNGVFCLGPKEKINEILNVQRYIAQWPCIPVAELHASSIQHPDELAMRWLLHSRRVKCVHSSGVSPPADGVAFPKSAGVGDRDATVWCCKLCVENLCCDAPRMPPLALANANFGGRHHPLFREATLATRMLASSARLIARQLFLGRGPADELHKGTTGNHMIISQPSPGYEAQLPNVANVTEGLVVLFCKTIDDVSKAEMLVVNRERYRAMVQHRRKVCPTFAKVEIDEAAIDALPNAAVLDAVVESAQHVPEATSVQTTVFGPASRIPMSHRQQKDDSSSEASGDSQGEGTADDAYLGRQTEEDALSPEALIENETIV